ncbi:uncharacterized protein [Typha latifolia]|uniref:uncharacterized protein n=1 Tax=Typha latifolia TaxID=4733 RepID=UPI003C2B44F4
MGNCFVLQEKKVIKIIGIDGRILRHQSPLKVYQALAKFPGHTISDALLEGRRLDPATDMRGGQLYYLLPPKAPVVETGFGSGVVRIKLVLSKQELKEMLKKEVISFNNMISLLQPSERSDQDKERSIGWRPALESIPEGNDLF